MKTSKINFSGLTNVKDILTVAGLDFTVNANYPIECNGLISSDTKGIISDKNHFFGTCKKNYTVIQPLESLDVADLLLNNGFKTDNCYLHESKIILKLNEIEKHKVQNVGDIYDNSIFLTADFSGKKSNVYSFYSVRFVCTNGMKRSKKESEYSLKHFSNYESKFTEVQKIIMNLESFKANMDKDFNKMLETKVSKDNRLLYINGILNIDSDKANDEISTRSKNEREAIEAIYNNKPDLKKLDNNVYKLFQAVNDFYSNNKTYKNSTADNNIKETSLVFGNTLEKNYNMAMALTN